MEAIGLLGGNGLGIGAPVNGWPGPGGLVIRRMIDYNMVISRLADGREYPHEGSLYHAAYYPSGMNCAA